MKKFILFFLLTTKLAFSQELVNSLDINLNKIKNVYQIEDINNNSSVFALKNKDNIEYIKTDDKFNVSSRFEYTANEKIGDYIGNSIDKDKYYTYWEKSDKFIELHAINFSDKTVLKSLIVNPIESTERIISSFTNNNLLYLISVTKKTSIINIHKITNNNVEKRTVDCANFSFLSATNKKINFWDFITNGNGIVYTTDVQSFFLDKLNFNSVNAAEKKKIYIDNDKIILSSDNSESFSQFLTISLIDFSASLKIISKQDENATNSFASSVTNSFLVKDKIFIAKFNNGSISILIKNFENQTLKSFLITENGGDEYINSDLIEETGGITNREIIKNKEKFLRRSYAKNPSIIVYEQDGNYYMTIAGVSYPKQQSSQMLGVFGLIGGVAGALLDGRNSESLTSYSNKIIVYIKSIINSVDFTPTTAKNVNSKFDDVRIYCEKNTEKESFLGLFWSKNHFYLLAQKKKNEKVQVYKF